MSNGVKATRPHIGNNEIGEVESALEDMRRSLDGKQYIEGYIQSLTHELKAPIAGIQVRQNSCVSPYPLRSNCFF